MPYFDFQRFKIKFFLLTLIVLTILMVAVINISGGSPFVSDVAQVGLGIALTLYMLWQTESHHITYNNVPLNETLSKKRWAKYITLTVVTKLYANLLLITLGTALMILVYDLIQKYFSFFDPFEIAKEPYSFFYYIATFISICILAPIWEELFFRGILLRRFLVKWRAPFSIFLSSLVFALIHLNPANIIYAFVLGMLFGYVYLKTQNIIVPIILHAVTNGISFLFILPLGGQNNENFLLKYVFSLDREMLLSQLAMLSVISSISTIIVVIVLVKKYPTIKAIPKYEYITEEEIAKETLYEV